MSKLWLSASAIALLASNAAMAQVSPADIVARVEAGLNLAEGEVSYDLDTRQDGSIALSNVHIGLTEDVVLRQTGGVLVLSAITGGEYDVDVRGLEHLSYELQDRGQSIGTLLIKSDDYSYQMRGPVEQLETRLDAVSSQISGSMIDDLSLHASFDLTLENTRISQSSGEFGHVELEIGRLLSESQTTDLEGTVMSRAMSVSEDVLYQIDWSGMPVFERIAKFEAGEIPLVLRDDYFSIAGSAGTSRSTQEWRTLEGGDIVAQSTAASSDAVVMLQDGALTVLAGSGPASVRLAGSMLPFSKASMAIDGMDASVSLPMIADGDVSDGAFSFRVAGVSASDAIWDSFDPNGALSRDPANLAIDIEFGVGLTEGFFLRNRGMAMRMPPTIESVNIEEVSLSAAGVDLSLGGRVLFDNSTSPPVPIGAIDAEITGVNDFIETLSSIGVVPAEMLMGVRMMMGVMLLPTDVVDQYTSRIEMRENGEITANGVPLR